MDKALRDTVTAIALDVRYWAEDRAKYACLSGMCAIASAELHRRLAEVGIASEIHVWYWHYDESAHVYCVVDDFVVDVTATQFKEFRNRPVVIMHTREAEVYTYYQTQEVFKDAGSLRKMQKRTKWPAEQVAFA